MKKNLDWQSKEIVNVFDEVTLWSAPFGRMLLENIPMNPNEVVVDLGFGTGFPLIELAQRFGPETKVIGVDIWKNAILRAKEKIKQFELSNIQILEQSADEIEIEENTVGLVCSNLGVNNFENRSAVYKKVQEILKPSGSFCFTTNDDRTFHELFHLFDMVLDELKLNKKEFNNYVAFRSTAEKIIAEVEGHGFKLVTLKKEETHLRFVEASAVFDHGLIRIGFREGWRKFIDGDSSGPFFNRVKDLIAEIIKKEGEFRMTIPMLYFHFQKI